MDRVENSEAEAARGQFFFPPPSLPPSLFLPFLLHAHDLTLDPRRLVGLRIDAGDHASVRADLFPLLPSPPLFPSLSTPSGENAIWATAGQRRFNSRRNRHRAEGDIFLSRGRLQITVGTTARRVEELNIIQTSGRCFPPFFSFPSFWHGVGDQVRTVLIRAAESRGESISENAKLVARGSLLQLHRPWTFRSIR